MHACADIKVEEQWVRNTRKKNQSSSFYIAKLPNICLGPPRLLPLKLKYTSHPLNLPGKKISGSSHDMQHARF